MQRPLLFLKVLQVFDFYSDKWSHSILFSD